MNKDSILVTGGAGYIGSHTICELLMADYEVTVIDNFSNSSIESIHRVEKICNKKLTFHECDVRDTNSLRSLFIENDFTSVIHFAGLKSIGESVEEPLEYYDNNVGGTLSLLQVMKETNVKNLIFSSSATVYGDPESVPISEDAKTNTTNPYGAAKLTVENILQYLFGSDPTWNIVILRYFNPVGAHQSGLIGEDPNGIPNNLIPYITQVAIGKLQSINIYGNDYPTNDGTGVRDYIHVIDLAHGHVKALNKLTKGSGLNIYNLGTGIGYSVLEMIKAFEEVVGKTIPYEITHRRPGDIAECYADPKLAKLELGWSAMKTISDMARDAWNWQKKILKATNVNDIYIEKSYN